MYVDTHCHITSDDYDDIPKLIDEIYKSGVEKIIVNGCDMKSNFQVLELIKEYNIVYGAIGFHPTELEEFEGIEIYTPKCNIKFKMIKEKEIKPYLTIVK